MTLDEFDAAILDVVQRNNLTTHAEIGEQVSLSPSSVRRRLTAMRAAGIITRDMALVDPGPKLMTVIVMVTFDRESVERYRAFEEQMRAMDEVTQCYSVAGDVDFILVVQVTDQEAYRRWGEETLMANPDIRRYDSHIAWTRIKFDPTVPGTSLRG